MLNKNKFLNLIKKLLSKLISLILIGGNFDLLNLKNPIIPNF